MTVTRFTDLAGIPRFAQILFEEAFAQADDRRAESMLSTLASARFNRRLGEESFSDAVAAVLELHAEPDTLPFRNFQCLHGLFLNALAFYRDDKYPPGAVSSVNLDWDNLFEKLETEAARVIYKVTSQSISTEERGAHAFDLIIDFIQQESKKLGHGSERGEMLRLLQDCGFGEFQYEPKSFPTVDR